MTEDQIYNAWLVDACPVCRREREESDDGKVLSLGGKTLSITYECQACVSTYVIGFRRRSNPIGSEILINNQNASQGHTGALKL